ncbi:hypothetical protein Tco_1209549 [Tanacetum coccineum]
MPKDPYANMVAAFQPLPSPDYMPGPEEPEQAPPSPVYVPYVPEPVYTEFTPLEDEVLPAEEQPLPVAASPTTDSLGYIPESDPEEDPTDYLADRGDDDDDESSDDDEDDDEDVEEDEDEEEEHLTPADYVPPPPVHRTTARMSVRAQTPTSFLSEAEAERFLALTTPPPSPLTPLSSPLPQIPSPPLPVRGRESSAAAAARQDDLVGAIQEIAPTTLEGINQRVTELATTFEQETSIMYSQMEDARDDQSLLRGIVNRLFRDRSFHRRAALLIEEEARVSRVAWAESMDASDKARSEGMSLRTTVLAQQAKIAALRAVDRARQAQLLETLRLVKTL